MEEKEYFEIRYKQVSCPTGGKPKWQIFYGVWRNFKDLRRIFGVQVPTLYRRFLEHVLGETGKFKTVAELCSTKTVKMKNAAKKSKAGAPLGEPKEVVLNHSAKAKMMAAVSDPLKTTEDVKRYQMQAYGELKMPKKKRGIA